MLNIPKKFGRNENLSDTTGMQVGPDNCSYCGSLYGDGYGIMI